MFLRKRQLSGGWYPDSPGKIADFLEKSRSAAAGEGQGDPEKKAAAVMVPHAGWFYSGRIAARGIASLDPSAETVLIIGGHLPGGGRPLFAGEDGIDGPFGIAEFDRELRDILVKRLNGAPDLYSDNTVEVQIPMVQYFFPKAK
ncbi:AmmeMemoRadiSam system protein B, partial [Treponema sp. OttesenSCG-928-L16]|nr:AmmeMemoRadiSam system protein B [Treponema sp. OttesenSCG-928-L16]